MTTGRQSALSVAIGLMCAARRAGTNAASKVTSSNVAATAINYFAYNFIKIHRTLRMSPAMAAGVTDRLWDVNDLVALWGSYERTERAA